MHTLYRKHRPQNFEEVVGQNHIKLTLEHEITSGKIAHAYLFCGPRGIGKTTIARVFAKAVNCRDRKEGSAEPCGACESCVGIRESSLIDLVEIDAASHTGVDNVRENIIASARVAPAQAEYKVFIIDEVHMLSASAFNSLLKIMEEPPAKVIFILCTTEAHKVPATIISRCQRFDFKKIPISEMVRKLALITAREGISAPVAILEEVARQSEGHMRDAESMLGQIAALAGSEITEELASLVIPKSSLREAAQLLGCLFRKDASSAIRLVNNLVEGGTDIKVFLSTTIELARKVMLIKISPMLAEQYARDWGDAVENAIREASRTATAEQSAFVIESLLRARNEQKDAFIAQMPLELAIISVCADRTAEQGGRNAMNALTRPADNAPAVGRPPAEKAGDKSDLMPGVTLEQISERWNEVLARVLKHNHSLSFILRACQPRSVRGHELCLAFKYKLHKERLDSPKIKELVENVLKEMFESPLRIEAVIDETIEARETAVAGVDSLAESGENINREPGVPGETKDQGDVISALIRTFGGKIID